MSIPRNEIARCGLVTRSEVKKLIADALESVGGSVDLTRLDVTDAQWTLRGNSMIHFETTGWGNNAGIMANGYCVLTFDAYESGINVWIADRVTNAWIGENAGHLEMGASAGGMCVGLGAGSLEIGAWGGRNEFGRDAAQNSFGTSYGSNHYYGI